MNKSKILFILSAFLFSFIYKNYSYGILDLQDTVKNENAMSDKEIANKFKSNGRFMQNGTTYTLYPDLSASFQKKNSQEKRSFYESNKNDEIILDKKHFQVYKKKDNYYNDSMNQNSNKSNVRKDLEQSLSVVYNNTTEQFAVLSGNIIVKSDKKLNIKNDMVSLFKEYELLDNYIYIFKFKESSNLNNLVQEIKLNPSVERVEIEVLENFNEAM